MTLLPAAVSDCLFFWFFFLLCRHKRIFNDVKKNGCVLQKESLSGAVRINWKKSGSAWSKSDFISSGCFYTANYSSVRYSSNVWKNNFSSKKDATTRNFTVNSFYLHLDIFADEINCNYRLTSYTLGHSARGTSINVSLAKFRDTWRSCGT